MIAFDILLRVLLSGALAALFAGGAAGAGFLVVLTRLGSLLWRFRDLVVSLIATVALAFGAGYLALFLVLRGWV